ncbi:MAG TPA: hypothetical protein VEO56_00715 [Bacteroidota bacterium]|nr:hypothetical protein [Bacteroidota bacterium]
MKKKGKVNVAIAIATAIGYRAAWIDLFAFRKARTERIKLQIGNSNAEESDIATRMHGYAARDGLGMTLTKIQIKAARPTTTT